MKKKKIVVIGGGAAGFFSAIQIAELHSDWEITILEKTTKILSKVKVSGGGRCNVTHACPDVELLLKKYPRGARFLKKAFYRSTGPPEKIKICLLTRESQTPPCIPAPPINKKYTAFS